MDKNNTNNQLSYTRLRWACRRGMLELDLVLLKFVDGTYNDLTDEDKTLFVKLLECEDPDLFSWLMGQELPSEPDLRTMVIKIRDYVRRI